MGGIKRKRGSQI